MVTVSVYMELKEEAESFQVHKNFITHYSPFFSAAFNGNFAEGESQKLELDDTEPAVFGSFVQWLYTQDIVDGKGSLPDQPTLVNLWILADKILVPRLQNQIIRALDLSRRASEEARPHPGMSTAGRMSMASITSTERPAPPRRIKQDPTIFHRLYECTAKDSPLRSYFVDICSRGSHEEISDEEADDYPHEMLVDIINKMRRRERHVCRAASSCSEYYVSEDIAEKRDARVK
ncbi:hypothetical protein B0O99DRAFT_588866 [Bisporella sp. PMI_857]|nr:hypothetical protein B0O99DRAFT_588866 [Bisporella sp. PMI_857]